MESIHYSRNTLPATVNTAQTTVGILAKISKCAQSVIDFVAALYKAVPKGVTVLKGAISFCSNFLILFQIFNTIDAIIKIKNNAEPLKNSRTKLNLWVFRQNLIQNSPISNEASEFKTKLSAIWFKPEDELTPCQKAKFDIFINSCNSVSERLNNTDQLITSDDVAKAYVVVKCRTLRSRVRQLKLKQIKFVSSIACDISEIVLTILGLAATIGIITLTAPSLPILFVALVVASLALSKKIFKSLHKKSCKSFQLHGLEAAIDHEYKHNKLPHRFNCLQHSPF
jgi:hypothetical protein